MRKFILDDLELAPFLHSQGSKGDIAGVGPCPLFPRKSDFHYEAEWQIMGWPAVKVDRVPRDVQ